MKTKFYKLPFRGLLILVMIVMQNFRAEECCAQCGPVISTFPYSEGFETVPAWTSGVVSGTNDWAWGSPTHPSINAAGGGVKCWCVGGLTGLGYQNSDQCWIMSPCFDFTTLNKPWINFKIYWECERQWDGMTLQYSLNGGVSWSDVGAFGDPVDCLNQNWFNYGNITWLNSLPAGTRQGWTGRTGPTVSTCTGGFGSNGWVTAKHCMPYLANQPSVRFRFLFGSGTTCNAYDGIAIDDIFIDNVPPNVASFSTACTGNTINFTNLSTPCPTSYSWNFGDPASGGANTSALTNPSHTFATGGSYTVTLTANGPCVATGSITIPVTVITTTVASTNVTCNGSNNGTATSTPSGVGPFTYSWSPGGQTTQTATGLSPGIYTVTITDPTSCPVTATINITQPTAVTATQSQTNISCFGNCNGNAAIIASGGTGPYSYLWSPSGGTGASASALCAGNYTCTITDANNCPLTKTFSVTQPVALTATSTTTSATCGSNNGSATTIPSGGTGPYTYSWAPSGGNSATANTLTAGTYTCTITDAHGCSATQTATVTSTGGITASITSSVNVSCNGGNNGFATVTPSGGTGPYIYAWSPSGGNAATGSAMTAGNYTVNITDVNGCAGIATVVITEPSILSATTTTASATCGNANGSATVIASGGVGPYTYAWSPSGGTGSTASGLPANNYTVMVTDANSCTVTAVANVTNTSSPTVAITATTNVSCSGGNNGSATANATGGAGGYSYSWTPSGGNASTGTGMIAGNYTITVTDANGCIATATATISDPPLLTTTSASSPVLCNGGATGAAAVTVSGGTPGYTYNWSPSGGTGATAPGLTAGNYTCTITDLNGCAISQTFTITEPLPLTLTAAGFNVSCFNSCDGQAVVIPNGGTPNYTFSWSTGCTTPSCMNVCAGSYTVDVTDANGCMTTTTTTITEPTAITITTSEVDAHCNLADGSVSSSANGGTGTLTYQWISGPANQNWNNITATTYSVIVTDQNNCSDTAAVTVNNINGMNASLVSVTNLTCFQSGDGAIVTNTAGGNGPYIYTWTPNVSATNSANGIPANTYSLTVTDANGCTSSLTATVTEPTDVTITASATPGAVCVGGSVQLSSIGGGGTPGYTYAWMPGSLTGNTQNILPVATTTYTAYVVDANGCSDSAAVLVTVNPVPLAALSGDLISGCAPMCVNFSDLSTIANPGQIISWSWDFGDGNTSVQSNPQHCYMNSGNYTIMLSVTTADGCTNTSTMPSYIDVLTNPVAGFTASPQPTTILDPVVSFTDISSGAVSWNWTFGDLSLSASALQNPVVIFPEATCYQVTQTATSADGCTDTASAQICIGPEVTLYVPNTFTPNGDGNNDYFLPVGVGLLNEGYELQVFDRWGNMIFESKTLNEGWDGRVRGHEEICQVDTYVWKIKVADETGIIHHLTGHINLLK